MKKLFFVLLLQLCSLVVCFGQTRHLTSVQTERILAFCRLYSTVKYYYPEPKLQNFAWEALAYKGYEIAVAAKNEKDFVAQMDTLFGRIAPGVQISKKEFDLQRIIPKDTLLYPERAFWQHRTGLNVDKLSYENSVTLNYIYKKPKDRYGIWCYPKNKELRGKRTRVSLWIKTEDIADSVSVFHFSVLSLKKENTLRFEIKAFNNEWKQYSIELNHPDTGLALQNYLDLEYPKKGTIYVDNLKIEINNDGVWEKVDVPNGNFERFWDTGRLRFWEQLYIGEGLTVADSVNAIEGKYCLKLSAMQEQILYEPQPVYKPHAIALCGKYKAYIPLQLYANDTIVFPLTEKSEIENFVKRLKQEQKNISLNRQSIAWAMQIWAAVYQDYSYRDAGFEKRIDKLLISTIEKLQSDTQMDTWDTIYQEFIVWLNDPHARIFLIHQPKQVNKKLAINTPIEDIDLTKTQCVITKLSADSSADLQQGDIILKINDTDIDSLLRVYRKHGISRNLQGASVYKMLSSNSKPNLTMKVLRGNEPIDFVFTPDTTNKKQSTSIKRTVNKLDRKKAAQVLHDSLMTKGLFYMYAESPCKSVAQILDMPTFTEEQENARNMALDSMVMQINGCKGLLLDVRKRGLGILHALNERYGIDISKKRYVTKTAFAPVAQFVKDTINSAGETKRNVSITVPIYVLVDMHTHSAPELALLNLREFGKAIFIGTTTSGAAGFEVPITIAKDVEFHYTTGQAVGLDNNPMSYQGTGIAPDVYVYLTAQGIREGRDEVLEKAIEIALRKTKK